MSSRSHSASHTVRLVSRASAPGHREITIETSGRRMTLRLRDEEAFDLAQHVQIAQEALPTARRKTEGDIFTDCLAC